MSNQPRTVIQSAPISCSHHQVDLDGMPSPPFVRPFVAPFPMEAALVSILSSLHLCAKLCTPERGHMPMQLKLVIIHSWDNWGVSSSFT